MITTASINPERFAAWIGHGISAAFAAQLLGHPRLRLRCSELVESRLGAASPSSIQAAALSLDHTGLAETARRAGAIWHGASIVPLIDGAAVRDLIGAIGTELRQLAIRHHALAPTLSETVPVQALSDQIDISGYRCLSAWCAAQPTAVGSRLALRLPTDEPPPASYRVHGPSIVDALLAADKGSMS